MSAVAAELPTKRAEGFVVVDVVGFEEPPQPPVTLSRELSILARLCRSRRAGRPKLQPTGPQKSSRTPITYIAVRNRVHQAEITAVNARG
jgi:hypothetical protein